MAPNSNGRAIAGCFGKRIANKIWAAKSSKDPSSILRRVAHYSSSWSSSSYDKNVEDQVCPAVVPDLVIASGSDKYWGPHPKTGVFGPADATSALSGGGGSHSAARASGDGSSESSVLDQTAWFRSLEDLEKPPPIA